MNNFAPQETGGGQSPMDKSRFDACVKQAEFFSKKVFNRQAYQWKVTLGLWALIAASVNFLWGKDVVPPWWAFLTVLLLYGFLWVRAIAHKNHDDQQLEWHFTRAAWAILNAKEAQVVEEALKDPPPKTPLWSRLALFGFLGNWAHLFEFLTTALLLVTAYLLLNHAGAHETKRLLLI
jgi:hypothetical protein